MKKGFLRLALLLVAGSIGVGVASTDRLPLQLREFEQQPRARADNYLRGVVDTINGINNQQRLLGAQPIFCPPPGPYPVSLERAQAILSKYEGEAAEESTHVTSTLPAAELVIAQLRYDYPCTAKALSRWRAQR